MIILIIKILCIDWSAKLGILNMKRIRTAAAENMANAEKQSEIMLNQSKKSVNIVDVNQFCLEEIFMYLDLEDLLNVANASKYLRPATMTPFTRSHGDKWIDLRHIDKNQKLFVESNNEITIFSLKTIFQMLRCFGQSISQLNLFAPYCNANQFRNYRRILHYMNEYCVESLTNLKFYPALRFERIE